MEDNKDSIETETKQMDNLNIGEGGVTVVEDEATKKEKRCKIRLIPLVNQIMKCLALFRVFSQAKILSDDNKPVELSENIFIGSFAAAENKVALAECKITHIVCAAMNLKENFPEDFKYLKLELLDSPDCNIKQCFGRSNEFISDCLANGGRIFVHW
jgi:hypothetical protein